MDEANWRRDYEERQNRNCQRIRLEYPRKRWLLGRETAVRN